MLCSAVFFKTVILYFVRLIETNKKKSNFTIVEFFSNFEVFYFKFRIKYHLKHDQLSNLTGKLQPLVTIS